MRFKDMKNYFQSLLFACFILVALNLCAESKKGKDKYISIEKLNGHKTLKMKLKSKGGHSGYCMNLMIENRGTDTCFAWVEAGRRLESADTTQQDIFIVKNEYAVIPPKSKSEFSLFGFCCISHNRSPAKGSAFTVGMMEGKDWQTIAQLINGHDFDESAIQAAVWVVSNGHSVSAIGKGQNNKNMLLLQTLADIKGITMPWYNIAYASEPSRVFSNKPKSIQADITYTLAYEGVVSVLVKDAYGIVQKTLLDNVPRNKGPYVYYLDMEIGGWKDGQYELMIVQDGNRILETRKFEINRAISGF